MSLIRLRSIPKTFWPQRFSFSSVKVCCSEAEFSFGVVTLNRYAGKFSNSVVPSRTEQNTWSSNDANVNAGGVADSMKKSDPEKNPLKTKIYWDLWFEKEYTTGPSGSGVQPKTTNSAPKTPSSNADDKSNNARRDDDQDDDGNFDDLDESRRGLALLPLGSVIVVYSLYSLLWRLWPEKPDHLSKRTSASHSTENATLQATGRVVNRPATTTGPPKSPDAASLVNPPVGIHMAPPVLLPVAPSVPVPENKSSVSTPVVARDIDKSAVGPFVPVKGSVVSPTETSNKQLERPIEGKVSEEKVSKGR